MAQDIFALPGLCDGRKDLRGDLIRREIPILARPQLPEAETDGPQAALGASLDSRKWPIKPLSSSL